MQHIPGKVGRRQLLREEGPGLLCGQPRAGIVGGCLEDQENLAQLENHVLDCQVYGECQVLWECWKCAQL